MIKTYNAVIQKPRLEIFHDNDSESPREWSNLGYFITVSQRQSSPDKNEVLENIVKNTQYEAQNSAEHIKFITKEIKANLGEKVLAIYPINKYEHSGISYGLGEAHGFDFSNNGFYIVTDKSQKETGTKRKDFVKVIKQELGVYNTWVNGEVYGYILHAPNSEDGEDDSCSGFYSLQDIKENLPKEWQNENLSEYIV